MNTEEILAWVIAVGDSQQELRLPVGCLARLRVQRLPEFQAAFVSPSWSEAKEKAMDARTRAKRPPHRVIAHKAGWVRLRPPAGDDFMSLPGGWELVE